MEETRSLFSHLSWHRLTYLENVGKVSEIEDVVEFDGCGRNVVAIFWWKLRVRSISGGTDLCRDAGKFPSFRC